MRIPALSLRMGKPGWHLCLYLRIADSPLMAHDPHRLAIKGQGKPLRQIGAEILKALAMPVESPRYAYNEDDPIQVVD